MDRLFIKNVESQIETSGEVKNGVVTFNSLRSNMEYELNYQSDDYLILSPSAVNMNEKSQLFNSPTKNQTVDLYWKQYGQYNSTKIIQSMLDIIKQNRNNIFITYDTIEVFRDDDFLPPNPGEDKIVNDKVFYLLPNGNLFFTKYDTNLYTGNLVDYRNIQSDGNGYFYITPSLTNESFYFLKDQPTFLLPDGYILSNLSNGSHSKSYSYLFNPLTLDKNIIKTISGQTAFNYLTNKYGDSNIFFWSDGIENLTLNQDGHYISIWIPLVMKRPFDMPWSKVCVITDFDPITFTISAKEVFIPINTDIGYPPFANVRSDIILLSNGNLLSLTCTDTIILCLIFDSVTKEISKVITIPFAPNQSPYNGPAFIQIIQTSDNEVVGLSFQECLLINFETEEYFHFETPANRGILLPDGRILYDIEKNTGLSTIDIKILDPFLKTFYTQNLSVSSDIFSKVTIEDTTSADNYMSSYNFLPNGDILLGAKYLKSNTSFRIYASNGNYGTLPDIKTLSSLQYNFIRG